MIEKLKNISLFGKILGMFSASIILLITFVCIIL